MNEELIHELEEEIYRLVDKELKKRREELDIARRSRREVSDVFAPSTVKISCGCSAERAQACRQRAYPRNEDGTDSSHLNSQCHIFLHELDLLEVVGNLIRARFENSEQQEMEPSAEGVIRFLVQHLASLNDPDQVTDFRRVIDGIQNWNKL